MKYPLGQKILLVMFLGIGVIVSKAFSDTEIDLGDNTSASPSKPTVVPTPKPATDPMVKPTAVPAMSSKGLFKPTPTVEITQGPTATPMGEKKSEAEEPTPTIEVIHGTLKMKDVYAAGIKNYQDQDYDSAILELKRSLEMEDPYSEKFYYAEAAAMLGVIYQFHVIHYDKAYQYYQLALKYEKNNSTAKKHLKEVKRLMKKGE